MRIGIDFDNTIANYDGVFYQAALSQNLIPSNLESSKSSVRNYLRAQNLEDEWTKLQGYIYGSRMDLAKIYEGFEHFINTCKKNEIDIFIVSHKSKYPYLGPKYNLHLAARDWLNSNPILKEIKAYFELTLKEKLLRIESLNCDYFIDDLPELLNEASFPKHVKRILFDPKNTESDSKTYQRFNSWHDIKTHFRF